MENETKYQKITVIVFFSFIIIFSGFYFLNRNGRIIKIEKDTTDNKQVEEEMPANLVEGVVNEREDEYLTLEIIKPDNLNGEQMKIVLNENTSYDELILEEHGKDDIRNVGNQAINEEEIKDGSRILTTFTKDITEENFDSDDLNAINLTLITVRMAD